MTSWVSAARPEGDAMGGQAVLIATRGHRDLGIATCERVGGEDKGGGGFLLGFGRGPVLSCDPNRSSKFFP
jgi:hypothetical protein